LTSKFIDSRTTNHAFDCDLLSEGRNQNSVTRLQPLHPCAHTMQQQIVQIYVFYQLIAAIVLHDPHRAASRRPTRLIQSIEGCGERTDVVGARALDIANHVDSNCAKPIERNIRLQLPELAPQRCLHHLLHFPESVPGGLKGADFRKAQPPLAINDAVQALRNTPPQINVYSISRAEYVIRPCRQIHGKLVEVSGTVFKNVEPK